MNSSDSLPANQLEPPKQLKYFLFAGRRIDYLGQICLILISPHNGRHFYVEEKKLNDAFVYLGSFLQAKRTTRRVLYDFEPLDKPKKFQVEVKEDVAFLVNMEATLEKIDGVKLFHCKTLGYVLRKGNLLPGNHLITAHLMSQSVVTTNGKIIHFEGTRTAAPKSPHKLMSKMSLAEPPKTGDIETGPASKLFLNSPFSKKIIAEIKITNPTAHRIGVGIKTNNRERFLVNPEFGVLDSKESIVVSITCKPFQFDPDEKYADKVKIGWLNAPRGAGKEFKKEWFEGKEKVLVKYLKIKYNP